MPNIKCMSKEVRDQVVELLKKEQVSTKEIELFQEIPVCDRGTIHLTKGRHGSKRDPIAKSPLNEVEAVACGCSSRDEAEMTEGPVSPLAELAALAMSDDAALAELGMDYAMALTPAAGATEAPDALDETAGVSE